MESSTLANRLRERGRAALARRFGIDPRALAALRVSLGLLLLTDLALRSRHLAALYADSGVLPRALLREQFPGFASISLHAASGSAWVQAALFVAAGAAAVALLLGYRTTLATAVSVALLASLHARNPILLNAGDSILRRLLFWSVFLPLGGRWSVDALRTDRGEQRGRIANVASTALLVQVVVVYAANAAFKLRGENWLAGDGVRYAVGLDSLTILLGDVLGEYPLVLGAFDRLWLGLLLTSVFLIALTGWPRAAFAGLFVGMHLGMAVTFRLGVFPFVSIAGLLVFLPPRFWDAAERVWTARGGRRLGVGGVLRRANRALPGPYPALPRPWRSGILGIIARRTRRAASAARPAAVGGLLALVLVWNAATLGYVALPDGGSAVDPDDHRWDMFAPEPRTDDGWYVVPGRLESGETRDAFRGGPVTWDRPPDVSATYRDVRWYKYLVDLKRSGDDALAVGFADYLCRQWNASHETGMEQVTVYYVEERVRLDRPETTERIELLRYSCADGDPTAGA